MAEFRNNRSRANESATNIMEKIVSNKANLIVGSEAMFKLDMPGTQGTGDSMFLIYNTVADCSRDIPVEPEKRPQTDHEWQLLLDEKGINNVIQYRNAWDKIVNNYGDLLDYIDPSLKRLMKTKAFKVVITTSITPELENLMHSIWGDDLQVFYFSNSKDITEFQNMWKKSEEEKMSSLPPSLIYLFRPLFGDNDDNEHIPINEEDVVSAIYAFHQYSGSGSNSNEFFQNFLFNRYLISVGCHYDDWKFRFFWYVMRNNSGKLRNGTIAFTKTKNDDSLIRYMQCTPTYTVEYDSRKFMDELSNELTSDDNWMKLFHYRLATEEGVFLSYAKEDFCLAWDMYKYLVNERHIKVWIDREDLYSGDTYKSEIDKNIKKCKVFMPLLSSQTKIDLIAGNDERYYMKEWNIAATNGKIIVPFRAGDYDCTENYHIIFREKCGSLLSVENDVSIEHINNKGRIADNVEEKILEKKH